MPFSLYIDLTKAGNGSAFSSIEAEPRKPEEGEEDPPFGEPRESEIQGATEEGSKAKNVSGSWMSNTVEKGLYIDLQKADKPGKGYGAPVDYYSKERYPERPANALDETQSSWVLPKGSTPQTNNTKVKQEGKESADGTPNPLEQSTDPASPAAPQLYDTPPAQTAPTPKSSQAPQTTQQGLLG